MFYFWIRLESQFDLCWRLLLWVGGPHSWITSSMIIELDISACETGLEWVPKTWFAFHFLWNSISIEKINKARKSPNPSAMNDGNAWLILRDSFLLNISGLHNTSKYILKAVEVVISLSIFWYIPLFTIREIATLNLFWNSINGKEKRERDFYLDIFWLKWEMIKLH